MGGGDPVDRLDRPLVAPPTATRAASALAAPSRRARASRRSMRSSWRTTPGVRRYATRSAEVPSAAAAAQQCDQSAPQRGAARGDAARRRQTRSLPRAAPARPAARSRRGERSPRPPRARSRRRAAAARRSPRPARPRRAGRRRAAVRSRRTGSTVGADAGAEQRRRLEVGLEQLAFQVVQRLARRGRVVGRAAPAAPCAATRRSPAAARRSRRAPRTRPARPRGSARR